MNHIVIKSIAAFLCTMIIGGYSYTYMRAASIDDGHKVERDQQEQRVVQQIKETKKDINDRLGRVEERIQESIKRLEDRLFSE